MKKILLPILTAGVLAAGLGSAMAITVIEEFNYSAGALGNTATNGTGQSGNWQLGPTSTSAATLSVANITWATPTGYNITPLGKGVGGVQNAAGSFTLSSSINFDADGEVWFSMLYRRPTTSGSIGLLSLNSGATEKARLFQTVGGGAMTTAIGGTGASNFFPATNTGDFLIVGKITTVASGTDTIAIDVTRSSETLGAFAASTSASVATTGTANSLYFWNFTSADSTGAYFGEVRMGDTYASVIPEPTTWALLAGGLTTLMVFRRRRQS